MAKAGSTASRKVERVMHEFKEGTLKSGSTGKPVKNPKQAVAIGLAQARKAEDTKPGKGASTAASRRTGADPVPHARPSAQDTDMSVAGEEDPGAALDLVSGGPPAAAPGSARADKEPGSALPRSKDAPSR